MTLKTIVKKWLKENGYDGLYIQNCVCWKSKDRLAGGSQWAAAQSICTILGIKSEYAVQIKAGIIQ